MRKVLRDVDTLHYWDKRWAAFDADGSEFHNMEIYPVKYVNPVMKPGTRTLEAGCGLGRVVKHYYRQGFDIVGCDYSRVAVEKLNRSNPELNIIEADITRLPYGSDAFDNVLTLGVFHSIEDLKAIEQGMSESVRCLKKGGHLIASVRADNLENRLIDYITEKRGKKGNRFHKWCFEEKEFQKLLEKHGMTVERCELITNVPFLNKFKIFRKNREINEGKARSEGFQLNRIGNLLYKLLKGIFPGAFGTTLVFTAVKN